MQTATKILIAAVCSLAIGVAFASPLLISDLALPYPEVPEGPKANFDVEIVYANFSIAKGTMETVETNMVDIWTSTYPYINVTYMVVLNVTNLADFEARISEVSFAAAEDIKIVDSALGGYSFERAGGPGVNFGGVVKGVWLDNEWVNVTWIPGVNYPMNLFMVLTPQHLVSDIIPALPDNATETGTWIEGVPIAEYYGNQNLEQTQIYINGAWVDVTGRVRPEYPQPTMMATHTLASRVSQNFGGLPYKNVGNTTVGPITDYPGWKMYNGNGPSYRWVDTSAFRNVWAPGQSRLITLWSTVMQSYSKESQMESLNAAIDCLHAGTIKLYASASSYIVNQPVEGVYYNTVSTSTYLKQVNVKEAENGYLYNVALAENQAFQPDQNGIEVFIVPKEPEK